jgi:FtsZ-binding cell division protein ZapB
VEDLAMSQFTWEPEPVEETQPELELQEPEAESVEQPIEETVVESVEESGALALSVDEFSALEERILRAVNLVKRERLARAEAEERANQAEEQLRQQMPLVDRLQEEVNLLRTERNQVHHRVEKLLAQLDALEL